MTLNAPLQTQSQDPRLKVFISYSRRDLGFADWLVAALERRGFEVLIDRRDLPALEDWARELLSFIQAADTVVFVVSPHSVRSPACAWEVEQVRLHAKRLAPIVIANVENEPVPPDISRLQYISFLDWARIEDNTDTLARALNTDVAWLKEHTRLGALARRWIERGRPTDLLIRGGDLDDAGNWAVRRPREAPVVTPEIAEYLDAARHEQTRLLADERQRLNTTRRFQKRAAIGLGATAVLVLAMLMGSAWLARETARREAAVLTSTAQRAIDDGYFERAMLVGLHGLPRSGRVPFLTLGWDEPEIRALEGKLAGAAQQTPVVRAYESVGTAWDVSFSPDGTQVAIAEYEGGASLWNAETGEKMLTLKSGESKGGSVAFSPDGQHVATIDGASAHIWNATDGKLQRVLENTWVSIDNLVWSPDSAHLAVAAHRTQGNQYIGFLTLFDATTGTLQKTFAEIPGYRFSGVSFTPDGKSLAAIADWKLRLFDASSGAERPGFPVVGTTLAFNADGTRFVTSAADGTGRIWNAATGAQVLSLIGHTRDMSSATYSRDGSVIVTASRDGTARVWNALTGAEIAVLKGHAPSVSALPKATVNADGSRVVTATGLGYARLWDTTRSREAVKLGPYENWINRAVWSPDGQQLAIALNSNKVRLISSGDTATESILAIPDRSPDQPQQPFTKDVAFSPDGKLLAAAYEDWTIRLWSTETHQVLGVLQSPLGNIKHLTFTPDGTRLLAAGDDKVARLWTVADSTLQGEFGGHEASIDSIAVSPGGQEVITVSNGACRVWDLAGTQELRTFPCGAFGASYSPDGKKVIVGSATGVAVFDVLTGAKVLSLKGHGGHVLDCSFSPDGERIVTASADWSVRVWDAVSGAEIAKLRGHENIATTARFSPDATKILTGSMDRTVRVWNARWIGTQRGEALVENVITERMGGTRQSFSLEDIRDPIIAGLDTRPSLLTGSMTLPELVQNGVAVANDFVASFGPWPAIVGAIAALIAGFVARSKRRSVLFWSLAGLLLAAIAVPAIFLLPARPDSAKSAA